MKEKLREIAERRIKENEKGNIGLARKRN